MLSRYIGFLNYNLRIPNRQCLIFCMLLFPVDRFTEVKSRIISPRMTVIKTVNMIGIFITAVFRSMNHTKKMAFLKCNGK